MKSAGDQDSKTPHQHATSQAPSDIAAADPSGLPKGTAHPGGGAARDGASAGQERQTRRKLSVKTRLSWAVRKDPKLLPHQFMLHIMRLGVGAVFQNHKITWRDKMWAAVHAAPFFAPKFAPGQSRTAFSLLDPAVVAVATPEELVVIKRVIARITTKGKGPVTPEDDAELALRSMRKLFNERCGQRCFILE